MSESMEQQPPEYWPQMAFAGNYPAPAFSANPRQLLLERNPLQWFDAQRLPGFRQMHFESARSALLALALARGDQDAAVLLPAYHCPALVRPFEQAGWRVLLYPMLEDLSPDYDALRELLKQGPGMLVGIRYFGFAAGVRDLAEFCAEHGLFYVEDCAHASLVSRLDMADAGRADALVTSWKKAFPVAEGSSLYVRDAQLFDRVRSVVDGYLGSALARARRKFQAGQPAGAGRKVLRAFDFFGRLQVAFSDMDRIARLRKRNFTTLLEGLAGSVMGRPLYGALQDGTVPYVFPFLLEDAKGFDELRNAGIPLLRWEEMRASSCGVSQHYRINLVQLPCHQDLTMEDMQRVLQACGG